VGKFGGGGGHAAQDPHVSLTCGESAVRFGSSQSNRTCAAARRLIRTVWFDHPVGLVWLGSVWKPVHNCVVFA